MPKFKGNPLDKSTIVSIYPKDVHEVKQSIIPGNFLIPAGTVDNPGILVIGPSSWFREANSDDQPLIEIIISSVEVANSIIVNWMSGLVGCDMNDAMPGLFFAPGELTANEVKTKFSNKLQEMKSKQDNWFRKLIELSDSLWARSNGNPLAISNIAIMAASELGINKPWTTNQSYVELVKCFACGSLRNPEYPICATCKAIDHKHPLAKEIKIAG